MIKRDFDGWHVHDENTGLVAHALSGGYWHVTRGDDLVATWRTADEVRTIFIDEPGRKPYNVTIRAEVYVDVTVSEHSEDFARDAAICEVQDRIDTVAWSDVFNNKRFSDIHVDIDSDGEIREIEKSIV